MMLPLKRLSTLALLFATHLVQAGPYAAFSTSALIPFDTSTVNDEIPFSEANRVTIKVGTGTTAKTFHPVIDTGTCGLMVSADVFPDWTPTIAATYPVGWEFLSSSKKLYSGNWIPKDVLFTAAGVKVKANFPILAVSDVTICPHYDEAADTNTCPTPASGTAPTTTHLPTGIRLMGIGFGRQADGQPQGNPDKNPFLNINSVDGIDLADSTTFRNGYIISKEGITVGLTDANTATASFASLSPGLTHVTDSRDWLPVPVCIAVDTDVCVTGTAVIDTGINQSYMTVPLSMKLNRHTEPSPSTGSPVSVLDDGSEVHWSFGPAGGPYAATFDFEVGDEGGMESGGIPSVIIAQRSSTKAPYVNTGRHFLRNWKVVFDAVGGKFGFMAYEE
jgi:hypothetical protein